MRDVRSHGLAEFVALVDRARGDVVGRRLYRLWACEVAACPVDSHCIHGVMVAAAGVILHIFVLFCTQGV